MKVAITGHTRGVGKTVYEHLISHGHDVIGLSRTNGYNLNNIEPIIEQIKNCDVFINNTYHKTTQRKLVDLLYKDCKIVVFGSIAADYVKELNDDYSRHKKELQDRCAELSLHPKSNILYLKLSFLEDAVSSPIKLSYLQVSETIEYWMNNPYFSRLDYDWKLTEEVKENMRKFYHANI